MTRKIHLQSNKAENVAPYAICASRSIGGGRVLPNSRTTYRCMASEIVPFAEFRNAPAADRCAHCVDAGLIRRNRQRREKGLEPVASLFD